MVVAQRDSGVSDKSLNRCNKRPFPPTSGSKEGSASRRNLVATWQELVDQHGSLVWRLAYRLLGNEHDAADCYQTVFVQAYEASKREAIENWPGFLSRLTTTRGIDLLRVRVRHRHSEAETMLREARSSAADDPQQAAVCRELIARLREALMHLPADQAHVFCLRYFEQLSNQEIGVQLATNANHVGVLLHRARDALRKHIGESNPRME
jgi:RNA polymerase sigma-70 factor, ECF subfamily